MGLNLYELACPRCGGQLNESGSVYKCDCCGKAYKQQAVTDVADQLRSVLNEQKQEAVANLRRQLWSEMHAQYINSKRIVELARDIKKYLPEDYFANFCEVANNGNDREVNAFLNGTSKEDMADYADIVLDFMLISARQANLSAISLYIEKAFKVDITNYDKYTTKFEEEAEKVNKGVYDLIIPRDVFLAYSSADIDKVIDLCDYLESQIISCFLALRNLRHGRGAVDNYDSALKTAIDNCKTVVFVSSANSRSLACDALTKELPYIKAKDLENAPVEFKRAYDKLPADYMMPRVEYLTEDYFGDVAEFVTKEFFHGLEWCKSKQAVAQRITKYLTEVHETSSQRNAKIFASVSQGKTDVNYDILAAKFAEEQRKIEEEKRKQEEEYLKAEEEKKALEDFIRNSEVVKGVLVKYKGKSQNVIISNNISSIDEKAFKGCTSLKCITISDSVCSIEDGAFMDSESLCCVTIPNSVTSIGSCVFHTCRSLSSVTIGSGVLSMGSCVFYQTSKYGLTIYCRVKKPLFGLPKGWNVNWLSNSDYNNAKVKWNYKG